MTKLSKKEKAVAKSIAEHIQHKGNSLDKRAMIEVLGDTFARLNPRFDRNKFYDLSYHHCPTTPMCYAADVVSILRALKSRREATLHEAIESLAAIFAEAGVNPQAFTDAVNA